MLSPHVTTLRPQSPGTCLVTLKFSGRQKLECEEIELDARGRMSTAKYGRVNNSIDLKNDFTIFLRHFASFASLREIFLVSVGA